MAKSCLAIVLAAGVGSRMRSSLPKVLHEIGSAPLVYHVLQAVMAAGADEIAVVAANNKDGDRVGEVVKTIAPAAQIYRQTQPLGTAHAALAARFALGQAVESDVLIVFGDTPLLEKLSLLQARDVLAAGADLVVMGFYPPNPSGYGRLVEQNGKLVAIVEEKDADATQKKIRFCNGGLMAIKGCHALELLNLVNNDNAAGEFYLPDIVAIAIKKGLDVRALTVDETQILGINTREELGTAEAIWQQRKRQEVMANGVTLMAPETVIFAHDTEIEADVIIEPSVFFGPGVKIATGAVIHAFSHIEGAKIGEGAHIGPFARLRTGSQLKSHVKIGNFCEIKQAVIHEGAKINHLSYIGNADIGTGVNIGAGTITCNYDGYNKWQTTVKAGSFVGSNSALVAPVTIGEGAYVASGSVITGDVPAQALAFGRARQSVKEGRAVVLRTYFKKLQVQNKKEQG